MQISSPSKVEVHSGANHGNEVSLTGDVSMFAAVKIDTMHVQNNERTNQTYCSNDLGKYTKS